MVYKLLNDDCLNVLPKIPDQTVDLVVTDCPYHIVKGGCTNKTFNFKSCGGMLNKDKDNTNGYRDYIKQGKIFKHNEIEFKEWLPEIYRVLKEDKHCYIMVDGRNLKDLIVQAENAGFKYLNLLVWDKGNVTPNRWYMKACEFIVMFRKGKAIPINDKSSKTILRIPNLRGNKTHPTEKPVELNKILIENSTSENDLVLDPFMGSGSCGVASKECKRNFIGIELDNKYYKIAKERMAENG